MPVTCLSGTLIVGVYITQYNYLNRTEQMLTVCILNIVEMSRHTNGKAYKNKRPEQNNNKKKITEREGENSLLVWPEKSTVNSVQTIHLHLLLNYVFS